jgi:hypothetical protein
MGRVNMAIGRCFATVSRVEWKVRPRRRDQEEAPICTRESAQMHSCGPNRSRLRLSQ